MLVTLPMTRSPDVPIFPNSRFPRPFLRPHFPPLLRRRFLPPFPSRFPGPLPPPSLPLLLLAQNLACPRCSSLLVKRRPALWPLFHSMCRPPGLALSCSLPPGLSSHRPAPAG